MKKKKGPELPEDNEIWTVERALQKLAKYGINKEYAEEICKETVGETLQEAVEFRNQLIINKRKGGPRDGDND